MRYSILGLCGIALLATTFLASEAPAQEGRAEPRDRRCVTLREIDKTTVVDDHTILFYMKNHDVYENRLTRTCPGLDQHAILMYRVVLDQLCDGDTINVLDNYGFAYVQTAACPLSVFTPIAAEDAAALLSKSSTR